MPCALVRGRFVLPVFHFEVEPRIIAASNGETQIGNARLHAFSLQLCRGDYVTLASVRYRKEQGQLRNIVLVAVFPRDHRCLLVVFAHNNPIVRVASSIARRGEDPNPTLTVRQVALSGRYSSRCASHPPSFSRRRLKRLKPGLAWSCIHRATSLIECRPSLTAYPPAKAHSVALWLTSAFFPKAGRTCRRCG